MTKSVVDIIEGVCEDLCTNYCKFPEVYEQRFSDEIEAEERLYAEKCDNCPLHLLG